MFLLLATGMIKIPMAVFRFAFRIIYDYLAIRIIYLKLIFTSFLLQTGNSSTNSGSRFIPFQSSTDDNHTDPPYQPNIIMPSHRKQSKKRRKKGRNRKRKNRKHRKTTYSSLEDYLNLTVEHRRNRNAKTSCLDCKIRKRKGRREKDTGRIKPSVLRKILEKVADETLSGARTGHGTINSLFKNDIVQEKTRLGPDETGWSYDQHWVNIGGENTITLDDTVYGSKGTIMMFDTYIWHSILHLDVLS